MTTSPLPEGPSYRGDSRPPANASYKTVFRFNGSDGEYPEFPLVDYKGTLYGTTTTNTNGGYGSFFKITAQGAEKTLYTFGKANDDAVFPSGALVELGGVFYGASKFGGEHNMGTIFRISSSGAEKVLYSFVGGKNGEEPWAGLTVVKGTLYGTTWLGGTGNCGATYDGCGTVFKVTTSGKETVLYSFKSIATGEKPEGGLAYLDGELYGTTIAGGISPYDSGIVFKISPSGAEKVIYSFKNGFFKDGGDPTGSLTVVKGVLYGTTSVGGVYGSAAGAGTVFRITTSGDEKPIYSFKGGSDGVYPYFTSLAYLNGALYGTTSFGGTDSLGTIFKVTTSGSESVLHSFAGGKDGAIGDTADGGPVVLSGKLYGVTPGGGDTANDGTVYSIAP
jgi:uncharacterized repeat protein (TIGR03803 family)